MKQQKRYQKSRRKKISQTYEGPDGAFDIRSASIITVTYNCENTIAETIESVLRQSCKELQLEYWIIDGKSTDRTLETVLGYSRRMEEQGIAYSVVSEPDGGIYDAMNKGIRMADADVIGFLNSGDWYEPDTLKVVQKVFAKTHCDLMFGHVRIYRQDGRAFIKKARQRKYQSSADWNHPTMFVRSGLYKEYPFLNKGIHDDYGFYLRMRKLPVRIVTADRVLANYRMGGVSNRREIRAVFQRIRDRYLYCYRVNGYSRWYLAECVMIETVKYLLG